jgi:hypothetical protein
MADKTAAWARGKGPAHGQDPPKATKPKAAKGGRMTLEESMVRYPERYPNTERMTEAEINESRLGPRVETEAREHLHKTESKSTKRARRAKAKAKRTADLQQGATPCGLEVPDSGGSMADETELSTGILISIFFSLTAMSRLTLVVATLLLWHFTGWLCCGLPRLLRWCLHLLLLDCDVSADVGGGDTVPLAFHWLVVLWAPAAAALVSASRLM